MVSWSQTVEDGGPRRLPLTTLHHAGSAREFIRIEMAVRRPFSTLDYTARLVVRASQVTGLVTAALERVRIE